MRKFLTPFLFIFIMFATQAQNIRVIEFPVYESSNRDIIDIARVEVNGDKTTLWLDIYQSPGYWIKISSGTTLRGNNTGNSYKLLSAEGVNLDQEHYIGDEGFLSCKLYFEPLSNDDSAFDYVEGNNPGDWAIYGVSLLPPDNSGKIKCHIEGTVANKGVSRLMLFEVTKNPRFNNGISIPVRDGKYSIDFYVDGLYCYRLFSWHDMQNGSWYFEEIITDGGDCVVNFDDDSNPYLLSATSPEMQKVIKLNKFKDECFKDADAIEEKIEKLHADRLGFVDPLYYDYYERYKNTTSDNERDSLNVLLEKLYKPSKALEDLERELEAAIKKGDEKIWEYISMNPSFSAFQRISSKLFYAREYHKEEYSKIYKYYNDVYSKLYPGHPYHDDVTRTYLQPGLPYFDYELRGNNGDVIKVSSLIKGHIAVIDLWASWCGPCRRHSREIVPVYEKYKDKGFVVVSIAREKSRDTFENVLATENYPWESYLELLDEFSIWKKHNIQNAAGGVYLISADGTVVAVSPSAEEIEKYLEENYPK